DTPTDPTPSTPVTPTEPTAPAIQREMRGLWVATVANIDWPTRTTLTADQQRAELVDIMTRAAATGINTIVLQVRPAADALYSSTLEPWGAMLTGTQGSDPGYDPLAFAIEEAHARGMELHAWINPFRAGNTADTARLSRSHLFHTRRDLIRVYGSSLWMDPGEPDVHEHSLRVVADIVRRYDIDAIHADDYFYPYVQKDASGRPIPFPDDGTHTRYGGGLARADWRRANVDRFVERMYREVHAIKPTLKVGISPFGIWRPGNPPSVQGLDAYASIYADSRKWLQQGWIDYLAPQLYWAISAPQQSYPALLDWWIEQNTQKRHVWPGLAVYRVNNGTSGAFTTQEIPDQIRLTRTRPGGSGHILYNTSWTLRRNQGAIATALAGDLYREAALVPASSWLDSMPPRPPSVTLDDGTLRITPAAGEAPRWWVVRQRSAATWKAIVLFGDRRTHPVDAGVDRVLVQAVDQAGNLSGSAEAKW
ncbi:MAG: family 10 glycosylhydrolase, partial [Gemmatimonadetes bacterium]|nr:family 10 glycosylhydrolase [Gemmatimonadota bacterium]